MTQGELSRLHKKCAHCCIQGSGSDPGDVMPYLVAVEGQPSLPGYDACMVFKAKGAFWRNCRQILRKTSFFSFLGFSL